MLLIYYPDWNKSEQIYKSFQTKKTHHTHIFIFYSHSYFTFGANKAKNKIFKKYICITTRKFVSGNLPFWHKSGKKRKCNGCKYVSEKWDLNIWVTANRVKGITKTFMCIPLNTVRVSKIRYPYTFKKK